MARSQISAPSTSRRHDRTRTVATFNDGLVCEGVLCLRALGAACHQPPLSAYRAGIRSGLSERLAPANTLVALLLGLLQPTSGRILLDGDALAGHERAWQRLIGYVPQDPYVLDDTLRRNVAFGVPDASIDEHRVVRACQLAQLGALISQLPEGVDTMLGEHGARLSVAAPEGCDCARPVTSQPCWSSMKRPLHSTIKPNAR